jgi:hypothetical protein
VLPAPKVVGEQPSLRKGATTDNSLYLADEVFAKVSVASQMFFLILAIHGILGVFRSIDQSFAENDVSPLRCKDKLSRI